MPSHTDPGFAHACKALAKRRAFVAHLRAAYGDQAGTIIECFESGAPLPKELDAASDDIIDFLVNRSPVVKEYEAEQDNGVYHVAIRGFPGAYFVQATEYANSAVFGTLRETRDYVSDNFGEFLQ